MGLKVIIAETQVEGKQPGSMPETQTILKRI
jgi:hypothetical protein